MKAIKRVWTISTTRYDDDGNATTSTDYYTGITKVRQFVRLLCCAGYNEQLEDDQEFIYQVFRHEDGNWFHIERHSPNMGLLTVLV